jgi:nitroreductase
MTSKLSDAALNQLFTEARTVHGFLPEPVSDEQIHQIYDLMKWGPTAFNAQPARYVFLKSAEAKARLKPALTPGNVPQVESAGATIIVAYDVEFFEHFATQFTAIDPKPFYVNNAPLAEATAFRNGSLQGAYLMMAVRALGLDCGAMSGFDIAKVNEEFFPDGKFKANFLLNIGRADTKAIWPRGPRLEFNQVAKIL